MNLPEIVRRQIGRLLELGFHRRLGLSAEAYAARFPPVQDLPNPGDGRFGHRARPSRRRSSGWCPCARAPSCWARRGSWSTALPRPITPSGGISAGIDLALHMVEKLAGPQVHASVVEEMEYKWIDG